ncbi:alternate-type signal peptide domain-containing protein [Ruania alba]|uniref:alternate-type signal peptide domain-containing protein n=1 Tax=Ruania alba TaxID=648782 RepID=UPI0015877746|nr:alternate-type signal peptide domain-containing protein [Ruania alba]
MNRIVKGSIAGGAGVALLLGGAGTFALWSESVTAEGGTVSTGNLDLALVADSEQWTDASPDVDENDTAFDPTTDSIVPGDVITFEQEFTVTAWGKNLRAQLQIDPDSYTIAQGVSDHVTVELELNSVGTTSATITEVNATTYEIDPNSDYDPGTTITFSGMVTITFDGDEETGANDSYGEEVDDAVDLDELAFDLTQVRP